MFETTSQYRYYQILTWWFGVNHCFATDCIKSLSSKNTMSMKSETLSETLSCQFLSNKYWDNLT